MATQQYQSYQTFHSGNYFKITYARHIIYDALSKRRELNNKNK